ncbi:Nonribosomal peptide synthetase [Penicillium angulare]|uniref:Nonribosomal peptide synthetase n=1 Tax=Penicillium angulare TaxID=116970 RepID=UPI00253F86C9|nr:Nonribosomal peptide synthetase [Penicillium angulare]KAJ5272650.1 Nonribosomal peptide synthetase [Penicillium angulare]
MDTQNLEPIAIIGSSCRFPGGASTPSKLWKLLHYPRDVLCPIPAERFDPAGFYHQNGEHHGTSNVRHSYLLEEDPCVFDAPFFSLNAREAEAMDPQHRVLLETVYECLENGGTSIQDLQSTQTGVYVGLMTNDYHDIHLRDMETIPKYSGTGTTRSILSNRVSYFFNWKGPSMTIDTACSSSLVAVHLAVQSLRSGETPVAIAAGANLIFGPEMYIIESKLHMLSPQGRSRMWDDKADGYGRGEGVAAVMLKTLSAAIRDGDHIECIIRNTGVNQDGRTPGITMPSPLSQEALIRDTYRDAGLDLTRKEDRPQFFEAHGTGTPVGDPLEAEAIHRAFFGDQAMPSVDEPNILHVGGIKTVIGHLEGAAGLAGLLKTSLALQHKVIPPNMHLDQLNPKVVPFTKNLRIPQQPIAWPTVSDGAVRRASVNSFGFGGTNAHAILESYDVDRDETSPEPSLSLGVTPYVFSANSDSSLVGSVKAFIAHVAEIDISARLLDLAWTLQTKRTELPIRKSFSGATKEQLLENMRNAVLAVEKTPTAVFGTKALALGQNPKILGVFTGQGAQWPSMGAELLRTSKRFADSIQTMEQSLDELADGPEWSLHQEMSAAGSNSKVHLAQISQPLCTAVQIALVDLLRDVNVQFSAVVGHSSGEIGAAYAAGIISLQDAIRVAYYRGVHAKHAAGTLSQGGSMMAVGTSFTEAQELCNDTQFCGRLVVAASNGPSTVTISGDKDAIDELKAQLDQKGTFARVLKVDKAYHSHHMLPCAAPYLNSLNGCGIQVEPPNGACWVSSVHGETMRSGSTGFEELSGKYWIDNMAQPVLFSQAVEKAVLDHGPFDVAIEIGPHAALKGPTTQTIKALTDATIPYHGSLNRGERDDIAFSSLVGFLWERFASRGVQLGQFTESLTDRAPALCKNLPGYQWDHRQRYWKESRLSKNFRQRSRRVHQLLGTACLDNVDGYDLRWRNILHLDEMPWTRGHKFQDQILFPAAGHVALALEASKSLSAGKNVHLIELENISIGKAITLEESGPGVEILFCLKRIQSTNTKIVTDFACYSCPDNGGRAMNQCSSGRMTLFLSDEQIGTHVLPNLLPPRPEAIPGLVPVDTEDFYDSMNHIGLDYTEMFRKMENICRSRNYATSTTTKPMMDQDYTEELIVHPALLDICFQTVIAAFCYPGDGSFWTPYLPTSIESIRVSPLACIGEQDDSRVDIEANITEDSAVSIVGSLGAYSSNGEQLIQLEGLMCRSFAKETAATDRLLFAETIWKPAVAPVEDGLSTALESHKDDPEELDAVETNERVAFYYLRTLLEKFTAEQVSKFEWWYQRLFEFGNHLLPIVKSGSHHSLKAEWFSDTYTTVQGLVKRFPDQIDLQLVMEVGENLPSYVCGTVPLLEVMLKEERLTRLYQTGLGVPQVNRELSNIAKQLSHQSPNMKILEIGAGTGGMTLDVLKEIDGSFGSYTFTDISTGFFEKAQARLEEYSHGKMIFSALDIEKDPVTQGYTEGSYDVIIASNVLHATRELRVTIENTRRLLRPGGYLLLNEVTGDMLRLKFIMSGLPGWWLGGDDGRRYSPTINPLQWDQILSDSGFSGVDVIRQDYLDSRKHSLSLIVSQAIDEMVEFLREPLLCPYMAPDVQDLFIVGGKTLRVSQMVKGLASQLRSWNSEITLTDSLLALQDAAPEPGFTVVCLDDLDEPILETTTPEKLKALQFLFSNAKHVLYVTRGAYQDSPYSMAIYGLGRTMTFENPDLKLQFLDIAQQSDINARIIAEELLRLVAAETLDASYLWTPEPEVAYVSCQKQIPRVVSNRQLNDKLNSDRRLITESAIASEWQIVIDNLNGDLSRGVARKSLLASSPADSTFDALFSLVHPMKGTDGRPQFLSVGKMHNSSQVVAAVTSELASSTVVSASNLLVLPQQQNLDMPDVLRLSSMWLQAQKLMSLTPSLGRIILHEPDMMFAGLARSLAMESGIELTFTTTDPTVRKTKSWLLLHPYGPKSQFSGDIWTRANVFISFTPIPEQLHAQIAGRLGDRCLVLSTNQLQPFPSNALQGVETIFRAVAWACTQPAEEDSTTGLVVNIKELDSDHVVSRLQDTFAVVDWTANSPVTVHVRPTVTDGLFSAHKTYILFGLSGDIGRSVADYMADHGARHIILTSRRPPNVEGWVERLKDRGATVKLLANDITNKEQTKALIEQVKTTMHPIGGVVNGAMVLQDKLFSNMDIEDWNAAVKPKIDGSRHLDECFSTDQSLEFFIMLSSLASVIGNSGQSNYNAGNMYCCALAANRRKRGLAASVIDIGKIVGIGYVARNQKAVISLRSHKFQPISEPLFHHMFAEAVISGRPGSGRQPVLTSGMQKRLGLAEEDSAPPLWLSNPRFSHMKWEDKKVLAGDANASASPRIPVMDQLKAASQADQAESILCTSFASRLATILQMSVDSVAQDTPLVDVGIDSLIAVEVRSWFLKELNVDVPVLKVIGGSSIRDICRDVLGKLSLTFETSDSQDSPPAASPPVMSVTMVEKEKNSIVDVVEIIQSNAETFTQDELESSIDLSLATPSNESVTEYRSIPTPGSSADTEGESANFDVASCMGDNIAPSSLQAPAAIRTAPLSHAQERMWLAHRYSDDPSAYNVAFAWKLQGNLDCDRFEAAIQEVIQRHEALHTAFGVNAATAEPEQFTFHPENFILEKRPIVHEKDVHAQFLDFRNHVFDLDNGQTLKAAILQLSRKEHVFMLCYHHIIMDGISLRTFLGDLNQAYTSPGFWKPAPQYLDYAVAEREQLKGQAMKEDLDYWKQQFESPVGCLPLLPLSRVQSRPPLRISESFTTHAFIKQETVAKVKACSRQSGSTSFHFYAAALQVLLFQLLDGSVDDFCIGIADANRYDDRYVDAVGFCLNLLPVRLRVCGQETISQLLKKTRTSIYGALAHSKVPFDVLLEELKVPRSSTSSPLFQVLLNYTLGIRGPSTFASCAMDMVEVEDAKTGCDLVVSIVETAGQDTALSFTMPPSLYLDQDCGRLLDIYVELVDQLSQLPDSIVSEVNLHSQLDPSLVSEIGSGPVVEAWEGWETTVSQQVDVAIKRYPDNFAIKIGFTDTEITYGTLNKLIGRAARALKDLNVEDASKVAILSEPSVNMIVFILAILRVGAAYVPLDSRNPHERLSSIIGDSSPCVLLTDSKMVERASVLGEGHTMPVRQMEILLTADSPHGLYEENESHADKPAFVLYTSGSTGTPKGVLLDHRNWVNQFAAVTHHYGLSQERVLQQSSPGFDMAIEQIFIALCNGGTVVVAPSSIRGDALGLAQLIMDERITYTMAVPSEYSAIIQHGYDWLRRCSHWRYAFSGGEKVTDRLRDEFQSLRLSQLQLINVYGPTEITVSCCRGDVPLAIDSGRNGNYCPVGRTMPNYQVHIVGPDGRPLPAGFPGEIYISGLAVGRGYLNQPELSDAKFLSSATLPAGLSGLPESHVVYRTGDRGRLLNDSSLVFLGRLEGDSQVKIRGQRVELDEIAHAVLQASKGKVANVQLSVRGAGTDAFLVAFAVFSNGALDEGTDRTTYLKQLRQRIPLPRYMWPSIIVSINEVPLSVNGKVDRKALDAILLPDSIPDEQALVNLDENETTLLRMWQEVLPETASKGLMITKDTDFFEAGGNSLSLVRLQVVFREQLEVNIPLVELVESCSLEAMARRLWSNHLISSSHFVWEDEASVPESEHDSEYTKLEVESSRMTGNSGKIVILTGASGFLGKHVLQGLVTSSAVSEVHCIAVRSQESTQKLISIGSPKIIIHTGDLTRPRLGLDIPTARSLASRANIIVHNGADVSFLKSYSSLKKANVGSTAELVRLAKPRRIPIHFVSSAGVAGFVPRDELPLRELSVAAYPPPQDSSAHGYQVAKWVSERLLEKANERYNLDIVLHRPTGIVGEEAPNVDILGNLLSYSRKVDFAPDMDGWDGYLDLVDVETVAQRIVSLSLSDSDAGAVSVVHTCSADAFPVHELGEYLGKSQGRPLNKLPMAEWTALAMEAGMNKMVGMYLQEVSSKRMGWYPRVVSDSVN